MGRIKFTQSGFIKNKKLHNSLLYLAVIIFSVLFIFFGNKIATKDLTVLNNNADQTIIKARVDKITDRTYDENGFDETSGNTNIFIEFEATVIDGENKGETVVCSQNIYRINVPEVESGDKVLLLYSEGQGDTDWVFMEYYRTDKLIIFGVLFVLLLLLFGRLKGFNTVLSLLFTCAAIFVVFIPSILSGKNIYISSVIICLFTITVTYLIVNGFNKKTLAAALGSFGGIFISGVLTVIMDNILSLTGYVNEESVFLTCIPTETPIDLRAIIFAAILIGALGAIMDVAMSISSSLCEVNEKACSSSFSELYKSGMNIGRDVMGTMTNTLILAYIGGSLSVVLLLAAYTKSLVYLMNQEMIVVELIQALVGSFGILLTLPLTSLICAALYNKRAALKTEC